MNSIFFAQGGFRLVFNGTSKSKVKLKVGLFNLARNKLGCFGFSLDVSQKFKSFLYKGMKLSYFGVAGLNLVSTFDYIFYFGLGFNLNLISIEAAFSFFNKDPFLSVGFSYKINKTLELYSKRVNSSSKAIVNQYFSKKITINSFNSKIMKSLNFVDIDDNSIFTIIAGPSGHGKTHILNKISSFSYDFLLLKFIAKDIVCWASNDSNTNPAAAVFSFFSKKIVKVKMDIVAKEAEKRLNELSKKANKHPNLIVVCLDEFAPLFCRLLEECEKSNESFVNNDKELDSVADWLKGLSEIEELKVGERTYKLKFMAAGAFESVFNGEKYNSQLISKFISESFVSVPGENNINQIQSRLNIICLPDATFMSFLNVILNKNKRERFIITSEICYMMNFLMQSQGFRPIFKLIDIEENIDLEDHIDKYGHSYISSHINCLIQKSDRSDLKYKIKNILTARKCRSSKEYCERDVSIIELILNETFAVLENFNQMVLLKDDIKELESLLVKKLNVADKSW